MGSRPSVHPAHRGTVRPGHRQVATPTHRAVQARYGRVAAVVVAAGVTVVSVLGAFGVLPGSEAAAPAEPDTAAEISSATTVAFLDPADRRNDSVARVPERAVVAAVEESPGDMPARSGTGRRVVFSIGAQRVWLAGESGRVVRTYLVSGSLTDNLRPGTYEVYSTSRHAVGVDDSGTMQFMVRFTRGRHAAIGFHDIPVHEGSRVQSFAELGTPQSHGCIRQRRIDARALWDFAPVGTKVVVTA